ncbi:MAG TPA: (Fe-S)-binding protein [Anaerolineae bacterium]|nr:(Fe-S)-binding protein [Anaerolineae bacterium]HNU04329.1 (Fe-S)-binding protein [Anaerolineae bacterium]
MSISTVPPSTVALFVTCLVDLYRPEVGEATVTLLEGKGLAVEFPLEQTCCGALAHQTGWRPEAQSLARRWVEIFEPCAAIVSPSPVCVAHVRHEMPRLLADEPDWQRRAAALAARTYELSEFLVDVLGITDLGAQFDGKVAYQPACQQLRMLHSDGQARALLAEVAGAQEQPLADAESCCGFGGLFSLQMPQTATAMANRKARAIEATEAAVVVTGETGCVLQMAGALSRRGSSCRAMHLAELLAGPAADAAEKAHG